MKDLFQRPVLLHAITYHEALLRRHGAGVEGVVEDLPPLTAVVGEVTGGHVPLPQTPHQPQRDGAADVAVHEPVADQPEGSRVVVRLSE